MKEVEDGLILTQNTNLNKPRIEEPCVKILIITILLSNFVDNSFK